MRDLVKVELPDGQLIWARVDTEDGPQDVGLRDALLKVEGMTDVLSAVATNVRRGIAAGKPDEVTVEFGLELAVGEEGLVAALAGVSTAATITVTLNWKGGVQPAPTPAPTQS